MNIFGGDSIGHYEMRSSHIRLSDSEWLLRAV